MRTLLVAVAVLAATLAIAPSAEAGPNCLQVYPWSELCRGNVGVVACYVAERHVDVPDAVCRQGVR